MSEILVIGAGIGGLSAAVDLAARGARVRVLEAGPRPGGKAGLERVDGVAFDTGPSVLTMPDVFAALFERAGTRLEDQLRLRPLDPAFVYLWPDGTRLVLHAELDATLDSVRDGLGPEAAEDLQRFLRYAEGIWTAAAPNFVYGDAPRFTSVVKMGLTDLGAVLKIDSLRSMARAIAAQVRSPKLRDLLGRYATYNGSSPYRAPATLNCISHVEIGLGGFGVEGGMYALVEALVRVAEGLGVELELDCPVARILRDAGGVRGVELADGGHRPGRAVVCNADAALVRARLLDGDARSGIPATIEPSMSGWTAVLAARPPAEGRIGHTVFFPEDYAEEFTDIFDRDRPPQTPTVYLCAQDVCHGRPGWDDGARPLFVMANAPAEPARGTRDPEVWAGLEARTLARAREAGLIAAEDRVVWRRDPAGLAARFAGSRGAIYGASSNSPTAAFKRPPNRLAGAPGVYLASGSAHPGGGVPLCALSGVAAARAVARDLDLGSTERPAAERRPSP